MTSAEKFERLTCTKAIRQDLRGESVRAASYTGAAAAADFVIRLGSTSILARLILPEHFGLVMMVMAVTAIAEQLRELGLSTATVQQKEITHEQVTNLFWINTLIGVAVAALICVASPLVAAYYRDPRLTAVTCVLATNFIFGGLMVQHQALLTRQLRLGLTSAVRLLSSLISTLLSIYLAWRGYGYWALVWKEVTRGALLTVGIWACLPWLPGLPSRGAGIRSYLRFGLHLSAANILGSIAGGSDRFLIGRIWGAAPVAMYRQAYQLLIMPSEQLLGPVYQVTQPGLSMLQSEPDRFRRFYQRILSFACVATMPLSVFVAVFSTEITRVVLGRRWADAAPLLLIMSLGVFIKQPVGSSAFVLISRGQSKMYLNLTLLQIAAGIVAICAGVPWGTTGVAIADVVATYLLILPRLHFTFKDSPFSTKNFFSTLARPVSAAGAMLAALLTLRQLIPPDMPVVTLIAGSVTGAVVFGGAWALLPGGRGELADLIDAVRAAYRKRMNRVEDPCVAMAN